MLYSSKVQPAISTTSGGKGRVPGGRLSGHASGSFPFLSVAQFILWRMRVDSRPGAWRESAWKAIWVSWVVFRGVRVRRRAWWKRLGSPAFGGGAVVRARVRAGVAGVPGGGAVLGWGLWVFWCVWGCCGSRPVQGCCCRVVGPGVRFGQRKRGCVLVLGLPPLAKAPMSSALGLRATDNSSTPCAAELAVQANLFSCHAKTSVC